MTQNCNHPIHCSRSNTGQWWLEDAHVFLFGEDRDADFTSHSSLRTDHVLDRILHARQTGRQQQAEQHEHEAEAAAVLAAGCCWACAVAPPADADAMHAASHWLQPAKQAGRAISPQHIWQRMLRSSSPGPPPRRVSPPRSVRSSVVVLAWLQQRSSAASHHARKRGAGWVLGLPS